VAERLSALDASFLYVEEPTTPMHAGGVALFELPEGGFDYDRLVALIRARTSTVPRYRQRVRSVPARIGGPVWVDDAHFDISYHVRRSALPRPGTTDQLLDLVGRIMSRPLDRERPLWEIYLVEGLQGGRFALLTKTHHAMVDGVAAVELGELILDATPVPRPTTAVERDTVAEPSGAALVAGAMVDLLSGPGSAVDAVRRGLSDTRRSAGRLASAAGGMAAMARTVARTAPGSPLNAPIGSQRRIVVADTDLADYKAVRAAHGGTVNDVVLAVVTGALRGWLMTRGEPVTSATSVRALVPVSIRAGGEGPGNRVSSHLVDLPVGEPNPIIRLHQVSYAMAAHKASGQAVGADALVGLAGFTPPTLHLMGARLASSLSRRLFNVVVTNVPGPQQPLYAAGARLVAPYPVGPLARGQVVSIGLTSYAGGVYYGLNADRDAMPDVDTLATCLADALAELTATLP